MSHTTPALATIYQGWSDYLDTLTTAIRPLTPEQLDLAAGPELRSLRTILAHIVGARARWFHNLMGEGGEAMAAYTRFEAPEAPAHSAEEILAALAATWAVVTDSLARWTEEDMAHVYSGEWQGESYSFTRQWIVWHLIEHDLHHGGEASLTMGLHGLAAPDL